MDYQPPVEQWTPKYVPIRNLELQFGQFQRVIFVKKRLNGFAATIKTGGPWHIITQVNGGIGKPAAALCGNVNILDSFKLIMEEDLYLGDYMMHACIDCVFLLKSGRGGHAVTFDAPGLETFDNRKI
jgi:hypothetical protein